MEGKRFFDQNKNSDQNKNKQGERKNAFGTREILSSKSKQDLNDAKIMTKAQEENVLKHYRLDPKIAKVVKEETLGDGKGQWTVHIPGGINDLSLSPLDQDQMARIKRGEKPDTIVDIGDQTKNIVDVSDKSKHIVDLDPKLTENEKKKVEYQEEIERIDKTLEFLKKAKPWLDGLNKMTLALGEMVGAAAAGMMGMKDNSPFKLSDIKKSPTAAAIDSYGQKKADQKKVLEGKLAQIDNKLAVDADLAKAEKPGDLTKLPQGWKDGRIAGKNPVDFVSKGSKVDAQNGKIEIKQRDNNSLTFVETGSGRLAVANNDNALILAKETYGLVINDQPGKDGLRGISDITISNFEKEGQEMIDVTKVNPDRPQAYDTSIGKVELTRDKEGTLNIDIGDTKIKIKGNGPAREVEYKETGDDGLDVTLKTMNETEKQLSSFNEIYEEEINPKLERLPHGVGADVTKSAMHALHETIKNRIVDGKAKLVEPTPSA